jgi:hypothetical protein
MACVVCKESSLFGRTCEGCDGSYHRACGLLCSVAGHGAPVVQCRNCALMVLRARTEAGKTTRTCGTEMSLSARLTMRGVEKFFRFLHLTAEANPEDYRRDRETKVFALYKLVGGRSKVKQIEIPPTPWGRQAMTVFVPHMLALDPDGVATVLVFFHGYF